MPEPSIVPNLDPRRQVATDEPDRRGAFRHVAACIDLSSYAPSILSHAGVISNALGTPLTLLHVVEGTDLGATPPDPVAWDIRRREARDALSNLTDETLSPAAESAMIEGRAAEQISLWTRHNGIDLTVLGSHGAGGITEWGLGSTAQKLIDWSHGSLLIVPCAGEAGRVAGYDRILVPLDGSNHAESVLPMAVQIAEAEQAELQLIHVVPVPELTETGPVEEEARELKAKLAARNERVGQAYLARIRNSIPPHVKVSTKLLRRGDVRSTLSRLLKDERPDLVVLAAHGRGRRSDVAFGSVAAYLIAHAKVPLLVVRREPAHLGRRRGVTPSLRPGPFRPLHA